MEKKKIIIITAASVAGLAVLSLVVMWIIYRVNLKKGQDEAKEAQQNLQKYKLPYIYPLQYGSGMPSYNAKSVSAAKRVAVLQQICIDEGLELTADGQWGAQTEVAITNLCRKKLGYETYFDTAMSPIRQCATTIVPSEAAWNNIRKVYKARFTSEPTEHSMSIIEGEGNSFWQKLWANVTLSAVNSK